MKNSLEKIAVVSLICIGALYIMFVTLIPFGVLDLAVFTNNVVKIMLGIMAVLFVGLSVYVLITTFSDGSRLKKLVLFSDSQSATRTTAKVVKGLVVACAHSIEGARCKKVHIRADEKYGFKLQIRLTINKNDAEETVDSLRCLIADTFYRALGVRFNSIDFMIDSIRPKYRADKELASKQAELIKAQRNCSSNYVHEAMDTVYDLMRDNSDGTLSDGDVESGISSAPEQKIYASEIPQQENADGYVQTDETIATLADGTNSVEGQISATQSDGDNSAMVEKSNAAQSDSMNTPKSIEKGKTQINNELNAAIVRETAAKERVNALLDEKVKNQPSNPSKLNSPTSPAPTALNQNSTPTAPNPAQNDVKNSPSAPQADVSEDNVILNDNKSKGDELPMIGDDTEEHLPR